MNIYIYIYIHTLRKLSFLQESLDQILDSVRHTQPREKVGWERGNPPNPKQAQARSRYFWITSRESARAHAKPEVLGRSPFTCTV